MEVKRAETCNTVINRSRVCDVSEACTDIMFIKMIMEFLELKVERPIKVYCDNVGAIFMGNNAKESVRTKHIDVKYHFIREHVVDGTDGF